MHPACRMLAATYLYCCWPWRRGWRGRREFYGSEGLALSGSLLPHLFPPRPPSLGHFSVPRAGFIERSRASSEAEPAGPYASAAGVPAGSGHPSKAQAACPIRRTRAIAVWTGHYVHGTKHHGEPGTVRSTQATVRGSGAGPEAMHRPERTNRIVKTNEACHQ
jgi:hypothetical protein